MVPLPLFNHQAEEDLAESQSESNEKADNDGEEPYFKKPDTERFTLPDDPLLQTLRAEKAPSHSDSPKVMQKQIIQVIFMSCFI